MTIIGVTGASGYIGKALVKAGAVPIFSDILHSEALEQQICEIKPDVILHLAAKSDPDWCEKKENNEDLTRISVRGTENVFRKATEHGIPCVLMSTGQIWKGGFWEGNPHREHDEITPPVNQYGLSKLAAEFVVKELFFGKGGKIIRSSFVFDATRLAPKIGSLKAGETLQEPTFIRRSFIHRTDIVKLLIQYSERINEMPDILHLAGSETVSYYDFMREVARQFLLDTSLVRPRRKQTEGHAPRPGNAGLDTSLASSLGFRIPNYRDGISRMRNES
jgi:dTDP-4-dehydrorhamnose reductase